MSSLKEQNDEVTIVEILIDIISSLKYIFSKWFIILPICLLVAVGAYFYERKTPTLFQADSVFLLQTNSGQSGAGIASALAANFGISSGNIEINNSTLIEIITSKKAVTQCFFSQFAPTKKEQILVVNYLIDQMKMNPSNHFPADVDLTNLTIAQINTINKVNDYLLKKIIRCIDNDKSSTITVEVKTNNLELSRHICNNLTNYLTDFFKKNINIQNNRNLIFAQNKYDSIKFALGVKERTLARLKDANTGITKATALLEIERLQRDVDILSDMFIQANASLEAERSHASNEKNILQVIDSPETYSMVVLTPKPLFTALVAFIITFFAISVIMVLIRTFQNLRSKISQES